MTPILWSVPGSTRLTGAVSAHSASLRVRSSTKGWRRMTFAKLAYELSEEFDTPVLLKMCTRVAHSQSIVFSCFP